MSAGTRPFEQRNESVLPEVRVSLVDQARSIIYELGVLCGIQTIKVEEQVYCPYELEATD